jgi:hypothetical protein
MRQALPLVQALRRHWALRFTPGAAMGFFMVALSTILFMGLFGFGSTYFGWSDTEGKVRLALFAAFTLGILCGYKSRG